MKKFLVALAFASVAILSFGQNKSIIRPRMEIVKTETEVNGTFNTELEVFYMNDENPRMYYASLGNLGIGGNIVQLEFDPIFELFIPLGGTLEEAVAKLEEIKGFFKMPKKSSTELSGHFSVAYPTGDPVTVTVTRRQGISKLLEFSIPVSGSENLIRATYLSKSDIGGLLTSLKIYRKMHPKKS
ncbi:MAG: hypothetical protein J5907_01040 [Bacteroidales bacterium]|nr:hypothetical protein [Bacteroidales bacterium]